MKISYPQLFLFMFQEHDVCEPHWLTFRLFLAVAELPIQNWSKWIFTQNCHWKSITALPWQLLVVLPILSVNPPFPAIKPTYSDLTPPLFAWASCSLSFMERIQTPRTSPPTRLVHDGRERGEPCTWATQRPPGDSSRGEQNRASGEPIHSDYALEVSGLLYSIY